MLPSSVVFLKDTRAIGFFVLTVANIQNFKKHNIILLSVTQESRSYDVLSPVILHFLCAIVSISEVFFAKQKEVNQSLYPDMHTDLDKGLSTM